MKKTLMVVSSILIISLGLPLGWPDIFSDSPKADIVYEPTCNLLSDDPGIGNPQI